MRYTIDLRNIASFADFVEAVNVGLIRPAGGEWSGNLDAFHDYLSWPGYDTYELAFQGADHAAAALGHAAMVAWLDQVLLYCHPSNRWDFERRKELASRGEGETLFEKLLGIVRAEERVQLRLG